MGVTPECVLVVAFELGSIVTVLGDLSFLAARTDSGAGKLSSWPGWRSLYSVMSETSKHADEVLTFELWKIFHPRVPD